MAYGYALAVSGDAQGAHNVSRSCNPCPSIVSYRPFISQVSIQALRQKFAFRWLDKAVTEHNDRLIYLKVDPIADPLRSDARFARLMNQIHMP